ncbi:hypothetical protein QCM77_29395 [Bradyrhizobium sp. SSUT18]|uniref:hypothetical protein n=1 Tax=unclassified Bradyrhizobium TaxID=2631580 RepID=UPI00244A3325|nr:MULTISPECIES: hypothetical protein [unclassified Bradyrhizobium]MDH2355072.1 hypothetical protein [Bradyrhizobium sp. SSUT112]MDH2404038.1 hypothetical protein [Bradyrhizobium sp. SSUT18]
MRAKEAGQTPPLSLEAMLSPHSHCDHHTLAVIARLDRAIQYAETLVLERRSRGVLDAPPSRGMTVLLPQRREPISPSVLIRARKSSFTIRVDQLFTPSREGAFTNAHHHPVKTPAIACVCRMRNAD